MADTIEWIDADGTATTLTGQADIEVLRGPNGRFMPPFDFTEEIVPNQAGSRLRQVRAAAKEIDLPVIIKGTTESNMRSNLRSFLYNFLPTRGDGKIRVTDPDSSQREISCRYKEGLEGDEGQDSSGNYWMKAVVVFRAFDPYWYDTDQTSVTAEPSSSVLGERVLTKVHMLTALIGFAACKGGYVLTTADDWATVTEYAPADTGTSQDLNDIQGFYDAGGNHTVYACGNNGVIIKTVDGGTTWSLQLSGTTDNLAAISFLTTIFGVVCGHDGYHGNIYRTTDGTGWGLRHISYGAKFLDIQIFDTNNIVAVGYILGSLAVHSASSTNGGDDFYSYGSLSHTRASSISAVSVGGAWIGTLDGEILKTADPFGGGIWSTATIQHFGSASIRALEIFSTTVGWAVGNNGTIYKTVDGSAWTAQTSGVTSTLHSISVLDALTASAAGAGAIIGTTDGGDFWAGFVADYEITINGDVDIWPIAEILGPCTNIQLLNVTSGKSLILTTTLTAGEIVVIDTRPGKKTIKKGETNLYGSLANDASIWPLQKGPNQLRMSMAGSDVNSRITFGYYERYLGA